MKSTFFGALGLILAGWIGYTLISPDPCERAKRSAAPVRVVFDGIRLAAAPWLEGDANRGDRLTLIKWSLQADESFQRFVLFQFYSGKVSCQKE